VSIERTLVLIKPDGVTRNLTGEILKRIEAKGYTLAELKKTDASRELLEQHYEEHVGQAVLRAARGVHAQRPRGRSDLRRPPRHRRLPVLAGTTDPTTAAPGTIRGDFGRDWGLKVQQNLVHGSDSVDSAEREIKIWFQA
jgi:nucleoside-diphosphate kinase